MAVHPAFAKRYDAFMSECRKSKRERLPRFEENAELQILRFKVKKLRHFLVLKASSKLSKRTHSQ